MFIDRVEISIKAGSGGNGHTSFFRDKLTMRGGPDGGDGGRGGDVYFVGDTGADNLVEFRFTKKFVAKDGENGGKRNMSGAAGADLFIPVPLGTRVLNEEGQLVADITENGQKFRALRGGAGGRGNARFATSKKQTPNFSQDGVKTKFYSVVLELSCIADVGLVGFPNVGKSTLLSIISRANPKIANYHFTTIAPNLGVVWVHEKPFIVADIPGIIEGASAGAGLGLQFLRHINRTRLLVHVIDISGQEGRNPVDDYHKINKELLAFSKELSKRPQIVVLNKTDVDSGKVGEFRRKVKGHKIFEISAATRAGVDELLKHIAQELEKIPVAQAELPTAKLEENIDKNHFDIMCNQGGEYAGAKDYFVSGPFIDNLIRGVVLSDTESFAYFQRRLLDGGVIDALLKKGMREGDTVHIADFEFEYLE